MSETLTAADPQLLELNETWSVLDEGGHLSVVRFVRDEALKRERLVRYSFSDFARKHETRTHTATGRPLGAAWLSWPGRRQFDRVVFQPNGYAPPDVLNLWRGFAVEPVPGSYQRIEEHLLDVVCRGDHELFDYLWRWMARLVQRPAERGEVAIVLRGKEGVGKSVVGVMLRKVFGQHALAVSSPKYVVGDFNSHLADVVFLDCAEALFAGDRGTASKLKALLTDDMLVLERKGADAVPWPNALSVLMTSNEEWVVPAGPESRRFCVLDVSDKHREDREYFRALWAEVNDPSALGAFLHDLLHTDLSGFDHRDFPNTAALREQRERSLTGAMAWALDLAERGSVRTRAGTQPWRPFFTTGELFEDYEEWTAGQRFQRALPRTVFAGELRKLGLTWQRKAKIGQTVPPFAREFPGFAMPPTVADFDLMVRKATGLLPPDRDIEAPEGAEEAAA